VPLVSRYTRSASSLPKFRGRAIRRRTTGIFIATNISARKRMSVKNKVDEG